MYGYARGGNFTAVQGVQAEDDGSTNGFLAAFRVWSAPQALPSGKTRRR